MKIKEGQYWRTVFPTGPTIIKICKIDRIFVYYHVYRLNNTSQIYQQKIYLNEIKQIENFKEFLENHNYTLSVPDKEKKLMELELIK